MKRISWGRSTISGPERRRAGVGAVSMVAIGALLAGCSGASDAGSSSGSGDPRQVAAAKEATAANVQPITTIGDLAPLATKPAAGKTFVWLECDLPVCKFQREGAEKATAAVGWSFKVLQYSLADPATQVSALLQALQFDPAAVGTASLQESQFAAVIPAYEKAGAVILNAYGDVAPTGPIISNYDDSEFSAISGIRLANWFIADSDGAGKGLVVSVDSVEALRVKDEATMSFTKDNCSGCSLESMKFSYADLTSGSAPTAIVGALQKDPSIKYVIFPIGSFAAGMPSALAAAGLTGKVKIAGDGGGVQNLTAIKSGTEAAWTQTNLEYLGWHAVDGALRHDQGLPIDNKVYSPQRLLTNDQDFTVADTLGEPVDVGDQFKKVWLVGS